MNPAERELREFLHRAVGHLGLERPYTPAAICDAVGAARGRRVALRPRDAPELGAFGVLIVLPDSDLIVFQGAVDDDHRDRIVFHELVHLLRGHVSIASPGEPLLCGQPDPELTAGVTGPPATLYDAWQEWEAETGAAVLSEWNDHGQSGRGRDELDDCERDVVQAFAGEL